jgi:osmotically-inducible protein OsmY
VGEERGWFDRASDEVSSWFGDEEAERRRRWDKIREGKYRGRGPKGYRRSDERIKEDINDRLTDYPYLDASEIVVSVKDSEVTLSGTVDNRSDKRTAEDIAESVSGVRNVQNSLRVNAEQVSTAGLDTSARAATQTRL